jgi:hypothetical protein
MMTTLRGLAMVVMAAAVACIAPGGGDAGVSCTP